MSAGDEGWGGYIDDEQGAESSPPPAPPEPAPVVHHPPPAPAPPPAPRSRGTPTWLRGRERYAALLVVVAAVVVIIVVATSGGGSHGYPANARATWMTDCQRNVSKSKCQCALNYFEANVPYSTYQAAFEAAQKGTSSTPSWANAAAKACGIPTG